MKPRSFSARRVAARAAYQPAEVFDPLLQQERTALAWERTAFAVIAAGLLFVRTAAAWHPALTLIGFAHVLFGGGLLIWAGFHYDELHDPLRAGESPVRPEAARLVGIVVTVFTGLATTTALVAFVLGL